MKKNINIGIIGIGYWGPNYVRIFQELTNCQFICASDLSSQNLDKIKKIYPQTKLYTDYQKMIKQCDVDALVITTPLNTHYEIAKFCLENDKNILVEKPFVQNRKEGLKLQQLAQKHKKVLLVGHVYEYNSAVLELKKLLTEKKLGELFYIQAQRMGLGPIRKHANALWDLATHDISIALYLMGSFPEKITAIGGSYIQEKLEDMVYLNLQFPKGVLYSIFATWIAPEKIRKTTLVGSEKMVVFDDITKDDPIKIYDRKINKDLLNSTAKYIDHQTIVSIGEIRQHKITASEPLKNQVIHFLECILDSKNPKTDAQDGINVIRVLEIAEKSLKSHKTIICRL